MALADATANTVHGVNEFLKRRALYSLRCGALNAVNFGFIIGMGKLFSKDIGKDYAKLKVAVDDWQNANQPGKAKILPDKLPDDWQSRLASFFSNAAAKGFVNEIKVAVASALTFTAFDFGLLLYKHKVVGDASHAHCAAEACLTAPFAEAAAKAINLSLPPGIAYRGLLSSAGLLSFTTLGSTRQAFKLCPWLDWFTPTWSWYFHLPVVVRVPETFEAVDAARDVATVQDLVVWQAVRNVGSFVSSLAVREAWAGVNLPKEIGRAALLTATECGFIWLVCQDFMKHAPVVGEWSLWARSCLVMLFPTQRVVGSLYKLLKID